MVFDRDATTPPPLGYLQVLLAKLIGKRFTGFSLKACRFSATINPARSSAVPN
jgi:hypothetical protein